MIQKSSREKNLAAWHSQSHQVTKDSSGSPRQFYHGSFKSFDIFDHTAGENGMFGRGIYLTSSAKDASNYASKDVGLNVDIPGKAEWLQRELEISYKEARDIVTEGNEQVYPLYVQIEKPIMIGFGNPIMTTKKEIEIALRFSDHKDPEFAAKIFMMMAKYGKDPEEDMWNLHRYSTLKARFDKMGGDPSLVQYLSVGKAIKELMIDTKADGIVVGNIHKLFTWMEEGSMHTFVRRPEQVKSIFNHGSFQQSNPSLGEHPCTSSIRNINFLFKNNNENLTKEEDVAALFAKAFDPDHKLETGNVNQDELVFQLIIGALENTGMKLETREDVEAILETVNIFDLVEAIGAREDLVSLSVLAEIAEEEGALTQKLEKYLHTTGVLFGQVDEQELSMNTNMPKAY